jgi:hypothetical protein
VIVTKNDISAAMLFREGMMFAYRIKAERRMRSRKGKNVVLLPADDDEEGDKR